MVNFWKRSMSRTPTAGRHGPEQVRALGQAGADQQAAVGAAADGEFGRGRVAIGDQPFGGGDEVVEDVLLVVLLARLVPRLAVLAAAAQVGDGQDAARLQPDDLAGAERGRQGDVEAAVAVQVGRVLAVQRQALAVGQEQRDARAVFAGVEDLTRLVVVGVESRPGADGRPCSVPVGMS